MPQAHPGLDISRSELDAFCVRWLVKELSLFGSAARGDVGPESDIDFMVEFSDAAEIGLWDLVHMQRDLEGMLKRPVDLVEKGTVRNPHRRASIERDLAVVYAV